MTRPVFPVCLLLLVTWAEVRGQASDPPPTPEQARAGFRVDPGLRVELVAAEPEVESPVAMAFDARGRLWVVEMLDYPLGPTPGQPPESRVKLLEDRDGDGRYETAAVFADHLAFANGIQPWRDGAIVTTGTQIVALRDADRDGRADPPVPLIEGFSTANSQLLVGHPTLGADGLIYVANGLRSGRIRRVDRGDGKPVNISGSDFRFDPDGDRCEPVAGLSQFGLSFDDWGRRFVCDNRHHLRHVVLPERALGRNPDLAVRQVVHDLSETDDPTGSLGARVYPLSRNWTTSSLHAGRFTAACGVFVYRGDLLPAPYRGAAFTCDPTGNLVHAETLSPDGATFRARPIRDGAEFLATADDWFRSVALGHGPDGALYVVDMGWAVIEHPEWMPPELQNRPDLRHGKNRGRIWRVVPAAGRADRPTPNLDRVAMPELVGLLDHPNAWHRATTHRLILERRDPAATGPLRALVDAPGTVAAGRLLAARLLVVRGELDDDRLLALLGSGSSELRENAVELAEPRIAASAPIRGRVVDLAGDPDPRVRFVTAIALGAWDDDAAVEPLARIARQAPDDPWTGLAVASSLKGRAGLAVAALVRDREGAGLAPRLREFASLVGSRRDPAEVVATAEALTRTDVTQARAILLGLAEGMARRGTRLDAFLTKVPPGEMATRARTLADPLAAVFAGAVADADRDDPGFRDALTLLAYAAWDQAGPTLVRLVGSASTPEVRLAAARAVDAQSDPRAGRALLAAWPTATPALRGVLLAALLRRPDRVALVLDAVADRTIAPGDLDAAATRQLIDHPQAAIRDRARALLRVNLPEDRREALTRFQPAVDRPGDRARGRAVFARTCAACHRVDGVGVAVGPDIGDSRTKTRAMLLHDIINPNAAIDGNAVQYAASLRDGRVVTGLIAAETATSLTLVRAEGLTETVLRPDVEAIRSTGASLMPEGLERTLGVADMADLLTFLKDWRQAP